MRESRLKGGRQVLTRRRFLKLGASAGALAAGGAVGGGALFGITETLAAKGGGGKGGGGKPPPARNPLYIPPTVSPSDYTLTAAPTTVDIGGETLSSVWAYNGLMPGPTIVASREEQATITLVNDLPPGQETITHWHGMIVDHPNDGQPIQVIPPGETYSYDFPINQRAAMNWYHPHPHYLTGEQVAMGLAGGFIIRDAEENALGLPSGAYEVPLVLRDAKFDRAGDMLYKPRSGGFLGDTPLVNGTLNPKLEVDTAQYRFRVLAGSNSRIFGLALSNGAPFTLIGNDGGLLEESVSVAQIDMSPGERVDVIVDFRGMAVDNTVMLRDVYSGWNLLEFVVVRQVNDQVVIRTALSTIEPLVQDGATRDFSFDGMTKINGKVYDVNRIDFEVPFDQTELWRFRTNGNAPHPVHVHGVPFQVQARTGGRRQIFPWERGWKDTVLLEDRETVEVLIRFDAYRGVYLIHCHKLEHEDLGMMANFEVV
jgi:FtsP/CotA-like multicopper oxidase with cupredoxin domain